ncbi:putative UDP-glycosyltransferase 86A1-like [Capsicum annuum]|nr:putative UDP-glycosyltransferase 86A1-like [Capsicum annuum]
MNSAITISASVLNNQILNFVAPQKIGFLKSSQLISGKRWKLCVFASSNELDKQVVENPKEEIQEKSNGGGEEENFSSSGGPNVVLDNKELKKRTQKRAGKPGALKLPLFAGSAKGPHHKGVLYAEEEIQEKSNGTEEKERIGENFSSTSPSSNCLLAIGWGQLEEDNTGESNGRSFQAVLKTASTFAPRASTATKNPAKPGTVLYTVFEVQGYASMLIGGALSFNLIFPSNEPDIWRLMGMWSIWMFTIPSLRARDCSKDEKEALNYLFLLIPLLNVIIPFFLKSFAVVWSADTVAFMGISGGYRKSNDKRSERIGGPLVASIK